MCPPVWLRPSASPVRYYPELPDAFAKSPGGGGGPQLGAIPNCESC